MINLVIAVVQCQPITLDYKYKSDQFSKKLQEQFTDLLASLTHLIGLDFKFPKKEIHNFCQKNWKTIDHSWEPLIKLKLNPSGIIVNILLSLLVHSWDEDQVDIRLDHIIVHTYDLIENQRFFIILVHICFILVKIQVFSNLFNYHSKILLVLL